MKRIFGSLLLLGGMFVIGVQPLFAAEPTLITLTETHQYTTQRVMTFLSQDPATDLFLQNYFSSYAKEIFFQPPSVSEPVSPAIDAGKLGDDDQNNRNPEPAVGTDESNTQSGGVTTNGGSDAGGSVGSVGTGGEVTQPTTEVVQSTSEPLLVVETATEVATSQADQTDAVETVTTSTPEETAVTQPLVVSPATETSGVVDTIALPEPTVLPSQPDASITSGMTTVLPQELPTATETIVQASQITVPASPLAVVSTTAIVDPLIVQPKTLQLVEIYPNTNGSDSTEEYVTIKNVGSESVNLNGWMLKDASGKKFTMAQDEQLVAGANRQFGRPETGVTLNNDTEEIFLIAPDQSIVDDVVYTSAPKGATYDRADDGWHWPAPTVVVPSVTAPVVTSPMATQPVVQTILTATPTPTVTTTPTQTVVVTSIPQPVVITQPVPLTPAQKTIEVTKLYPNTSGDDSLEEFIQIQNTGTDAIDLNGWAIKDASNKTFTVTQNQLLAAGATLQLDRQTTGIVLNNDAEDISLIAPDKSLIETISYSNAPIGETYDRTQNSWHWSSTTTTVEQTAVPADPVGTVVTNTTPAATTSTTAVSATVKITPTTSISSITSAKTKPDTTVVEVTGIVRVLPGILGKQFFYIEDAQDGVQIYKYDAVFPDMQVGQSVRVKGEMSTSGTERRIKVTTTGGIELYGSVTEQKPIIKSVSQLETSLAGKLIQTSGTVVSSGSGHLLLEQDGVQLDLPIITTTKIDLSVFKAGMSVQATGILRPSGNVMKLYPRSQEDLLILDTPKPPALTGTTSTGKDTQNQTATETALVMILGTILVLSSWVTRHFIQKKHLAYANHILKLRTETSN